MLSDSDFVPEESDTTSIKSTESSEKSIETIVESIFDTWEEEDVNDLSNNLYQLFDDYHVTNILSISSSKFYPDMLEHVSQIIFQDLLSGSLCEQDDYEEVYEFAENTLEVWLDFAPYVRRSISYGSTLIEASKTNNTIDALTLKIEALQNIPQPKQKSKEWHEFRYDMISASNLWKALGSESNQNSLIYEKCCPLDNKQSFYTNTESALHWGNKYEPVSVKIYEFMFQTEVGEFGCIQHPQYSFIGASPDGINIDPSNPRYGRMLEIKNIVNREITGIPKEEYWTQTQIQMETCDLDECDFLETRFLEYSDSETFYQDNVPDYKGVILYFIERTISANNQVAKSNDPTYIYMDLDAPLTEDDVNEWIRQERDIQKENGLVLFKTIYWYLAEMSCVYIPRNREWFRSAIPKISSVWDTIVKERVSGYEHRAPKKKIMRNQIQVSNEDGTSSYIIENMPATNSICLIKLDQDGNLI